MQFKTDEGSFLDFNKQIISIYDKIIREYEGLDQLNLNNRLYLWGSKNNDSSVAAHFLKYDSSKEEKYSIL